MRLAWLLRQHMAEVYRYRALIAALVGREVKARYRGAFLGFLWTVLNPLSLMVVYTLVFSVYMRIDGVPNYVIFILSALLPWTWLSASITQGANAILAGGALIKKVRFPPQVLPITVVLSNLVNYLLSLLILPVLCAGLGHALHGGALVWFPPLVIVTLVHATALAMLLSATTVVFRDLQHLVPNLMLLAFFVTPIVYPPGLVPPKLAWLVRANPLAALMAAYQDIFYHGRAPSGLALLVLLVLGLLLLAAAILVFERFRDHFAEEV
jgi:ABC-type polysaccharide/polyol phosphate export permease